MALLWSLQKLREECNMVEFYINQIIYKGMDIEKVPVKWRQTVKEELFNRGEFNEPPETTVS